MSKQEVKERREEVTRVKDPFFKAVGEFNRTLSYISYDPEVIASAYLRLEEIVSIEQSGVLDIARLMTQYSTLTSCTLAAQLNAHTHGDTVNAGNYRQLSDELRGGILAFTKPLGRIHQRVLDARESA